MAPGRLRTALEPGEAVLGTWVAGLPTLGGRGIEYGGTLVLTGRRVVWEPINLPGVLKLAPGLRGLESLTRGMPLGRVVAVRPDPDRRALLHIDGLDGSLSLLIGASRMSPVWSRKNRAARDDAVSAIRAALAKRSA
jgi:hypothetical protein